MFYIYVVGDKYLKIKITDEKVLRLTKNIENASYWTNKKEAKSWSTFIKKKFPSAELKEVKLQLK